MLSQYQLRLPMIDLARSAPAAALDRLGRRRCGCASAPKTRRPIRGPPAYGLGGTEPTATDADVVLGYIAPDSFLGGRMKLHRDRALEAIRTRIADPLFGGDVIAAAAGILRWSTAEMADLIRK